MEGVLVFMTTIYCFLCARDIQTECMDDTIHALFVKKNEKGKGRRGDENREKRRKGSSDIKQGHSRAKPPRHICSYFCGPYPYQPYV